MAFIQFYVGGLHRTRDSLLTPLIGRSTYHCRPFRLQDSKRTRCSFHSPAMMGQADKEKEFQDEEEMRLQNDKRFVFREFSKVSAAAVGVGLVLFFYDILISLVAVGIGFVYAIAVLLDIPGASTLFSTVVGGATSVWSRVRKSIQKGYRAIRREVRKGLED